MTVRVDEQRIRGVGEVVTGKIAGQGEIRLKRRVKFTELHKWTLVELVCFGVESGTRERSQEQKPRERKLEG